MVEFSGPQSPSLSCPPLGLLKIHVRRYVNLSRRFTVQVYPPHFFIGAFQITGEGFCVIQGFLQPVSRARGKLYRFWPVEAQFLTPVAAG